jgi:YhcH/YjgK/YiaL family protein
MEERILFKMIYGNVNSEFFEQQTAVLPKPLKDALHYLKEADLVGAPAGNTPIEIGGVPMILQVMDLKTNPRQDGNPEIHRKYIDLQLFVKGGPEISTFFVDAGEETVREDLLDSPRDILFYENRPETSEIEGRVVMQPGAYAIYFPWDVHIPGQCGEDGPKDYRKIVLKVPAASCY